MKNRKIISNFYYNTDTKNFLQYRSELCTARVFSNWLRSKYVVLSNARSAKWNLCV